MHTLLLQKLVHGSIFFAWIIHESEDGTKHVFTLLVVEMVRDLYIVYIESIYSMHIIVYVYIHIYVRLCKQRTMTEKQLIKYGRGIQHYVWLQFFSARFGSGMLWESIYFDSWHPDLIAHSQKSSLKGQFGNRRAQYCAAWRLSAAVSEIDQQCG